MSKNKEPDENLLNNDYTEMADVNEVFVEHSKLDCTHLSPLTISSASLFSGNTSSPFDPNQHSNYSSYNFNNAPLDNENDYNSQNVTVDDDRKRLLNNEKTKSLDNLMGRSFALYKHNSRSISNERSETQDVIRRYAPFHNFFRKSQRTDRNNTNNRRALSSKNVPTSNIEHLSENNSFFMTRDTTDKISRTLSCEQITNDVISHSASLSSSSSSSMSSYKPITTPKQSQHLPQDHTSSKPFLEVLHHNHHNHQSRHSHHPLNYHQEQQQTSEQRKYYEPIRKNSLSDDKTFRQFHYNIDGKLRHGNNNFYDLKSGGKFTAIKTSYVSYPHESNACPTTSIASDTNTSFDHSHHHFHNNTIFSYSTKNRSDNQMYQSSTYVDMNSKNRDNAEYTGNTALNGNGNSNRDYGRERSPSISRHSTLNGQSHLNEEISMMKKENDELRRRLEDDSATYQRRLIAYEETQNQQQAMVEKLQKTIETYKKNNYLECVGETNDSMIKNHCPVQRGHNSRHNIEMSNSVQLLSSEHRALGSSLSPQRLTASTDSYQLNKCLNDDTFRDYMKLLEKDLEEEKLKIRQLENANYLIKQELEDEKRENMTFQTRCTELQREIKELQADFKRKKLNWKDEENSFYSFCNEERERLMNSWDIILNFKRKYSQMKQQTEQELFELRNSLNETTGELQQKCSKLHQNIMKDQEELQNQLEREKQLTKELGEKYLAKEQETVSIKNNCDILNQRLQEVQQKLINSTTYKRMEDRSASPTKMNNTSPHRGRFEHQSRRDQIDEHHSGASSLSPHRQTELECAERRRKNMGGSTEDWTSNERCSDPDATIQAILSLANRILSSPDAEDVFSGKTGGIDFIPGMQNPDIALTNVHPRVLRSSTSPIRSASPLGRHMSSSPIRNNTSATLAYADPAFNAVHAAFNKKSFEYKKIFDKLTQTEERFRNVNNQLLDEEKEKRNCQLILNETRQDAENLRRVVESLQRSDDKTKNLLDITQKERQTFEKELMNLNERLAELQGDKNRLSTANIELQRLREHLEDELTELNREKSNLLKECEKRDRTYGDLDFKHTNLKQEFVNIREAFDESNLDREILKHERDDLEDRMQKAKKERQELDIQLSHYKSELENMSDRINKLQTINDSLLQEKQDMQRGMQKIEHEKANIDTARNELEMEKQMLKQSIAKLEIEKNDVENDRDNTINKLNITEMSRQQLEEELGSCKKEKMEYAEQITLNKRQKNVINDNLMDISQQYDMKQIQASKLTKEKEDLIKQKTEFKFRIASLEKLTNDLQDQINVLRADKTALEGALKEARTYAEQQRHRKEILEVENEELLMRREQLSNEIDKLNMMNQAEIDKSQKCRESLENQLADMQQEHKEIVDRIHKGHNDELHQLELERDKIKSEIENNHDQNMLMMRRQNEDSHQQFDQIQKNLEEKICVLTHEREGILIAAENDKQAALSIAQSDMNLLREKLEAMKKNEEGLRKEHDRQKRDSSYKMEQDSITITNLQEELNKLRASYEEESINHDRDSREWSSRVQDLTTTKEAQHREIVELKTQLKGIDDAREMIRRELNEAKRSIKDGEEKLEQKRKEILELKKNCQEEMYERQLNEKRNGELRSKLKTSEQERIELKRALEEITNRLNRIQEAKEFIHRESHDLRQQLREAEKQSIESRRELLELRRLVKLLDSESKKKNREVEELQDRVKNDELKEDENRRESNDLKQKINEQEASYDSLKRSLAHLERKYMELEQEKDSKDKEFCIILEDLKERHRIALDEKKQLLVNKEIADTEMNEVRLILSSAESQIAALESQLNRMEAAKKEIEFKLSNIVSSIRRTVGVTNNRCSRSNSPICRNKSQERMSRHSSAHNRSSPASPSLSPCRSIVNDMTSVNWIDVDPENIRLALRDFSNRLNQTERSKDDAIAELKSMKLNMNEQQEVLKRTESRLQQLQRGMLDAEENKKGTDLRLTKTQTALVLQEESIRRLDREKRNLMEQIVELERRLHVLTNEKSEMEMIIRKCKDNECRLIEEKRNLGRILEQTEMHLNDSEVQRRALEGDIQRLQMVLKDKETELRTLQDKEVQMNRQIAELEDRNTATKIKLDKLAAEFHRSQEGGALLKDKMSKLNTSLNETTTDKTSIEMKMMELKRINMNLEQDKHLLEEKLENTRASLNELKKQNVLMVDEVRAKQSDQQMLESKILSLESEISKLEVLLDNKKGIIQEDLQKINKLQIERNIQQEQLNELQKQLQLSQFDKMDLEKWKAIAEKDKHSLRRTLDRMEKEKLEAEDIAIKSVGEVHRGAPILNRLEDDNRNLRNKIQEMTDHSNSLEQKHTQNCVNLQAKARKELFIETNRLRRDNEKLLKQLESSEREKRTRLRSLEQQNTILKDQLMTEMRRKRFNTHNANLDSPACHMSPMRVRQCNDPAQRLHLTMNDSLNFVSDMAASNRLEPTILEYETEKLDKEMKRFNN
ncbi:hypothetical protein SNEBB_006197 [Seison nebaliae]|nr:hypothetical protein SNEBB_006197 [Seison nebaliae]